MFIRATLTQYDWHFSPEDFDKVSVYISMEDMLKNKADFIRRLESVSEDELRQKQKYIAKVASRLQYSVVSLRKLFRVQTYWLF